MSDMVGDLRDAMAADRVRELVAQRDELLGAVSYLLTTSAPMTAQQEECWKSLRSAAARANCGGS